MNILYDSDFYISLLIQNERNHNAAKKIYNSIGNHKTHALKLVQYEIATVLSRKFAHSFSIEVIKSLISSPTHWIVLSEQMENDIWEEYYSYTKKNISFVDCANLVTARNMKMKIASFDTFYPSDVLVTI